MIALTLSRPFHNTQFICSHCYVAQSCLTVAMKRQQDWLRRVIQAFKWMVLTSPHIAFVNIGKSTHHDYGIANRSGGIRSACSNSSDQSSVGHAIWCCTLCCENTCQSRRADPRPLLHRADVPADNKEQKTGLFLPAKNSSSVWWAATNDMGEEDGTRLIVSSYRDLTG